jgi:hypothetical protein
VYPLEELESVDSEQEEMMYTGSTMLNGRAATILAEQKGSHAYLAFEGALWNKGRTWAVTCGI